MYLYLAVLKSAKNTRGSVRIFHIRRKMQSKFLDDRGHIWAVVLLEESLELGEHVVREEGIVQCNLFVEEVLMSVDDEISSILLRKLQAQFILTTGNCR